jgi:hypothetical protein
LEVAAVNSRFPDPLPDCWLSIDPGDVHVGYASWDQDVCTAAVEMTPDVCVDTVWDLASYGVLGLLVVERYTLYPWMAAQQSHSEMWTPQMIGALSHIARRHNVPLYKPQASKLNGVYKTPLATRLHKHQGTPGKHAKDAEAHGLLVVWQVEMQREGMA